jgi:hypothetical protein
MTAEGVVTEVRNLPADEQGRFHELLFADEQQLGRLFAAVDRLPRRNPLTEDEVLALPRARVW